MRKTKLLLALAISAMVINTSYANEEMIESNKGELVEEVTQEKIIDAYVIDTINEEGVDLYKKSNPDEVYAVPKKEFKDLDLIEGMEVMITSNDVDLKSKPSQFAKIYDIKSIRELAKESEEKLVRDFVVKEIHEEGVDLYEVGEESNLYNVPKSEFKDMEVRKGKVFTITSDSIATKSIPAQFGKIYSIAEKKEAKTMVKSYQIEEVSDGFVTIHEKGIKESKFIIDKKYFGKTNPKVGEAYKIETSEEILTSEPAQFARVYKVELEKEAEKQPEKPRDNKEKPGEKTKETEDSKENKNMVSDIFIVEEINESGVTVARKSNKVDKYLVPKKDFGKLEIKVGKEYKIYTDDIVLTSMPAQFGKIFKIEEVKEKPSKTNSKDNKEGSTNPKTGLVGSGFVLLSLIGAGFAYKKIK